MIRTSLLDDESRPYKKSCGVSTPKREQEPTAAQGLPTRSEAHHETVAPPAATQVQEVVVGGKYALSDREAEVMQWLRIGKTNHEIGCILEISACTVKNHLQRIFRKLEVFNRTHAVAKFFIDEQALRH